MLAAAGSGGAGAESAYRAVLSDENAFMAAIQFKLRLF